MKPHAFEQHPFGYVRWCDNKDDDGTGRARLCGLPKTDPVHVVAEPAGEVKVKAVNVEDRQ